MANTEISKESKKIIPEPQNFDQDDINLVKKL